MVICTIRKRGHIFQQETQQNLCCFRRFKKASLPEYISRLHDGHRAHVIPARRVPAGTASAGLDVALGVPGTSRYSNRKIWTPSERSDVQHVSYLFLNQ